MKRAMRVMNMGLALLLVFGVGLGACESSDEHGLEQADGTDTAALERSGEDTTAPAAAKRARSRWGAEYFPNVELVTHEGKAVRFFDDLIKDKIVVINFIYTSCPNSCPLETARLAKVHKLLEDRMGKDVFMYSISIDPGTDTPEELAKYAKKFRIGTGWYFLTGEMDEIDMLRKKLGLYIDEIQDNPNDHNLSLIIGNQRTGQWMKRSPFENPYVLAMQIGGQLDNWKLPSMNNDSYASAPKLREMSKGEDLFRTRCSICHTIGGGDVFNIEKSLLGPDLLGVVERREPEWLNRWMAEPDKMLAEEDPIAMALYLQYNQIAMPNLQLNQVEIDALLEYIASESERIAASR